MFITLGTIGFGKLLGPSGFEGKLAISYAEHQVIEGKPLLQYTGDGLGEISLSFLFHADFCDPQAVWDDLVTLATSHRLETDIKDLNKRLMTIEVEHKHCLNLHGNLLQNNHQHRNE
jgi:hypothetical protein